MILIIYVFLLLLAVYFYTHYNRSWITLVIYIFFITNAFLINIFKQDIVKPEDFALILVVLLSIGGFSRNRNFFSIKNDFIAKLLIIWMTFYFLEFCITVITNAETFSFSLKVVRKEFLLLSYFIFRRLKYQSLIKSMQAVFIITFIVNVFYIIQFFTSYPILSSEMDFSSGIGNYSRMRSVPAFTSTFLLYCLISKKRFKLKIPFILISIIVLSMSMNRTPIFSLGFVVVIFFALKRDIKKIIITSIIGILLFPIISLFISARSEGNSSSLNDIYSAISIKSANDYSSDLGTFAFRIAMLIEKTEYLINNPQNLLTGVGSLHEDSKIRKKFNFQITPYKADKSGEYSVAQEIDTGDIMWTPIIFRYGLIGFLLYIILIYKSLSIFYKNRNKQEVLMLAFLFFILTIVSSFSSASLSNIVEMCKVVIFYLFFNITKSTQIKTMVTNLNSHKVLIRR